MSTAAPPRPEEPSVPKRRNTELALSLFAVAIAMFAYANVGLADNGKLPTGMWTLGAGLVAVVAVANLLTRYAAPYADPLFLPLAILLNGVGLVLIHRLDLYGAAVDKVNPKAYLPAHATNNQLMFTALGIILLGAFLLVIKDHKVLQRYAYISMVVGLFLVALPAMLPASMSSKNGAKSWVFIAGFSIQPAEFGKLLLVSFFAAFFMAKRDALRVASRKFLGLHIPRGRDLGPIAVCWVLAMLILVFETDLGVSLMFFGAFVVLLYIATERTSWLLFGLAAFVGGAVFIATTVPHVQSRVTGWLHPFDYEVTHHGSDQLAQSMYGFATGGIFGKGLNQGRPWLVGFAANADFILVSVGEELGMIGLFALMMVYMLIVMRGFKTAVLIRDNYGKLLAAGLASIFALQVFITAGGVMRVIPLTGLPMPFLAAGGSALVANWVMIAAMIRLSDAARRPPPPAIPLTEDELRSMRLAVAVRQPSAPEQADASVLSGAGQHGLPENPGRPAAPPNANAVTEAVPHLSRPQYGEQTMIRASELTEVVPPPTPSSDDGEQTEAMAWDEPDPWDSPYQGYGDATAVRASEQTTVNQPARGSDVSPASSHQELGEDAGETSVVPPAEEQPPPPRRADRRYGE